MYQSTSYAIAVDTKTDLFSGMYINTMEPILSFRTINHNGKRLLLISGNGHKTGENIELGNRYELLENTVKKLYPDSEVLYRWSTEDCISLDKIPYIGSFSKLMPNMFVATGFKKWGMTTSNIASNIIIDKILGKENPYEDIFTATRLEPLKNHEELKNMIKQSLNSLVINKFKIPEEALETIKSQTKNEKIKQSNMFDFKHNNGFNLNSNNINSKYLCCYKSNNFQ